MVFPVVMYGCESWTMKKAERLRIDSFELWFWRKLLRVPWTARRSNQSILKEISPGCSLEGLMLKLKLQYFGHLMLRVDSLEKTLMLGRTWGQEEKATTEDEMAGWHHWLHGRESEWTPGIGDGQGGLVCCRLQFMGSQRVGHNWATELNWTGRRRKRYSLEEGDQRSEGTREWIMHCVGKRKMPQAEGSSGLKTRRWEQARSQMQNLEEAWGLELNQVGGLDEVKKVMERGLGAEQGSTDFLRTLVYIVKRWTAVREREIKREKQRSNRSDTSR